MSEVTTREEHPLPAVVMHWVHLVSLGVLIWTGFYIHMPFYSGSMGLMRQLHFIFMWLFIFTAVVRVYWAFLGGGSASAGERRKIRDYRFFFPQKENRSQLWQTAKYYLFLRKTHPRTAKYNPLQKLTYAFWLLLIIAQAITGGALWTPTSGFFQPLTYMLGGPVTVRMIHYLIMWVFIVTVALHIYLSVAEAVRQVPLMFWWIERPAEPGEES